MKAFALSPRAAAAAAVEVPSMSIIVIACCHEAGRVRNARASWSRSETSLATSLGPLPARTARTSGSTAVVAFVVALDRWASERTAVMR